MNLPQELSNLSQQMQQQLSDDVKKIMKNNCCYSQQNKSNIYCPVTHKKGTPVNIITLQNLLKSEALSKLNTSLNYFFCDDENCPIVYFNQQKQTFSIEELKVPVFQKDKAQKVPVCYCFNLTRQRIYEEIKTTGNSCAEEFIKEKIKARLCACDINNPQGSCCLANIRQTISNYQEKK